MKILLYFWPKIVCLSVFSLLLQVVFGQSFIKNPSFESNLNDKTDPLAAGTPMGWPYYGAVDDWTVAGGGVNDLMYDAGGPFHNQGTPVPDGRRVAFKQGSGAISQEISGLTPGKRYWIQFHFDVRNGSDLDLAVRFSTVTQGGSMDEELALFLKPRPAMATGSPYYTKTVPFTPDATDGTLSFQSTARGDSTFLLDGVNIVQRNEEEFPIQNSSFEASGVVFGETSIAGTDLRGMSGWIKSGVVGIDDGTGGKADNGKIPEQALVAFIDSESSIAQTLELLVPNSSYTVQFHYNAKLGATSHLQLAIDGAVIWEQDVAAVGGTASYRKHSVTFKPAKETATISFKNAKANSVILLDQIQVVGKLGTRLPPFEMAPSRVLLRSGEVSEVSLSIPSERLTLGPATIKIRSGNTNIFTLPDADVNGEQSLVFTTGIIRKTFKVLSHSVGSASVTITDSASLLLPTDVTTIFVAGSTLVLNPSFEVDKDSGVGTFPVSGWTTSGGNIGMAEAKNPFLAADDLIIPDRNKVLRIQGGGLVSQRIQGLSVGKRYGLQFFYNARSSGYPYKLALTVNWDGKVLGSYPDLKPAALDSLSEYRFEEISFVASATSGLLEFKAVVTQGDATLFLDAISIIPRMEGEIVVKNSSFESTGMAIAFPGYIQPGRLAGWEVSGGGYGVNAYSPKTFFVEPFFDNGINSDQDHVFFGQGPVKISQVVRGLVPEKDYTLVFDYNNRSGIAPGSTSVPSTGQVDVTVDGTSIFTTEEFLPVDTVLPWAGFHHVKPFYQVYLPIKAASDALALQIAHVGVVGDETFLIDNVRLIPGKPTRPAISKEIIDQNVKAGDRVSFVVAGSGQNLVYRWYRDGVLIKDTDSVNGSTTSNLQIASARDSDAGIYSALVTDGLGLVGSSARLNVEAAPIRPSLTFTKLGDGRIKLTWPVASGSFKLTSATAVSGPYSVVSNSSSIEGEVNSLTLIASDDSRFFRLAN